MKYRQAVAPGSILTWLVIKRLIRQHSIKGTFLDVGCGEGYLTGQLLSIGLSGVAIEPSQRAYQRAVQRLMDLERERILLVNGTLESIPQASNFDLGCAFMVIEHQTQDVEFLREIRTRVRPNGYLLVAVPAGLDRWTYEDEIVGHVRRYSSDTLAEVLRRAGITESIEVVGVGFPFLNLTELIRNWIMQRRYRVNQSLGLEERTADSGIRDKVGVNVFPGVFSLIFNRLSLKPLDWISQILRQTDKATVLVAIGKVT
jgi:SAM-dependent methyltransferase